MFLLSYVYYEIKSIDRTKKQHILEGIKVRHNVPTQYNQRNTKTTNSTSTPNVNGAIQMIEYDKLMRSDTSITVDTTDSHNFDSADTDMQLTQPNTHEKRTKSINTELPFEDEVNSNIIYIVASVFYYNPSVSIFAVVVFLSGKFLCGVYFLPFLNQVQYIQMYFYNIYYIYNIHTYGLNSFFVIKSKCSECFVPKMHSICVQMCV